jgi:radical SAM protein with 4Fe4S-binding SPASM domain
VLGADGAWLTTQMAGEGTHRVGLDFNTGASDEVSFVLFADEDESVVATIDFSKNGLVEGLAYVSSARRERAGELVASEVSEQQDRFEPAAAIAVLEEDSVSSQAEIAVATAAESSTRQVLADDAVKRAMSTSLSQPTVGEVWATNDGDVQPDRLFRQTARWARGEVRYYCQKPWTDMNNFTVDGRMDVCCIATGASQEAYQLGNLNRQSFQEIWNGPMARKFRRTVNSDNKMPPCARCPMSHAYQGFLFSPHHTNKAMFGRIVNRMNSRGMSWLAGYVSKTGSYLVNHILFTGFKR